jgi:glycosyltransferase involved in cell wall biosynthesis
VTGSPETGAPLVSVIMAAYNAAEHIGEALESILAQDYEPLEVVVVDDGSTDDTAEIVSRFPGVVCARQENQGPAAARNAAAARSTGDFLANFDSDDLVPPTRIRDQVTHLLAHPEVGAVFGRQEWMNAPAWMARDSVYGDVDGIPLSSVMFRRAVFFELGGYDTSFVHGEDMDLLMRMRERGVEYGVISEVVLFRRYQPSSLTGGRPSREPLLRSLRAKLEREQPPEASEGGAGR